MLRPAFGAPRQQMFGAPRQLMLGAPRQQTFGAPRQQMFGAPRQLMFARTDLTFVTPKQIALPYPPANFRLYKTANCS